jgi:hypothetical protein
MRGRHIPLVLGRLPGAPPPPVALPHAEIARPSLPRLASKRGLSATVTATSAGTVVLELRTSAFGEDSPIAYGYATVTRPGTRTVRITAPAPYRAALRGRTRLRTQFVVSQCTADGREYEAASELELR